mmetsp:Transcript_49032/g.120147  ORF Transcript_49032/g.120147 Transcript_49032/m.120147 type:complete len:133 (+) Transcript_49032:111-509(+)
MVPVIMQMSRDPTLALPIAPLAWALAWGADIGGNGTIVGATDNIVVAGISKAEGYPITFLSHFKIGFPNMLISCLFANFYLLTVYVGFGIGVGYSLYEFEEGLLDEFGNPLSSAASSAASTMAAMADAMTSP